MMSMVVMSMVCLGCWWWGRWWWWWWWWLWWWWWWTRGQDQSSPLFISVTNLPMKYIQDFWGKGDFVIILVPGVCEYHTSSSGRWAFAFNDKFPTDNSYTLFPFYCPNILFKSYYLLKNFKSFFSADFLFNFQFSFYISSDFPRGPHLHFFGGCSWLDQKDSAPAKVFLLQITEEACNDKQDVKI